MGVTSSSTTRIRYTLEDQWGVLPTTPGGVITGANELRLTGETLNFNLTKDSSKEMNPQRQIRSLAVTNAMAQGDLNIEFSFGTYDALLSSAMRSPWDMAGMVPVMGVSVDVSDPDFDVLDFSDAKAWDPLSPTTVGGADTGIGSASSAFGSFLKQGVYVSLINWGTTATPTADNAVPTGVGYGRVIEDYTGDETVKVSKGFFTSSTAVGIVSIYSSHLKIGNQQVSMTIEKKLGDNYFTFGGMEVSKMDLNLSSNSFLTGSFSMMGKNGVRTDASPLPAGFLNPAPTSPSMSAVDGVAEVLMDGEPVVDLYGTWVKSMTLSLDNQLEGQSALGVLGSIDNMAKTIQLTGGMSLYLTDGSLYDAFVNSATMQMSFMVRDPQGNAYVFALDKIDFNEMPANASADGQAVMLDSKYTGVMGEETLNSLTIYSLPGTFFRTDLQANIGQAAGYKPNSGTYIYYN